MKRAWVGCHYPGIDHVFIAGVNAAWVYAVHPHTHTLKRLGRKAAASTFTAE